VVCVFLVLNSFNIVLDENQTRLTGLKDYFVGEISRFVGEISRFVGEISRFVGEISRFVP